MTNARIFDTVEVKLPAENGSEYVLFRDLMGKSELMTNLVVARRLRVGQELKVKRVGVNVTFWSGDNLQHLIGQLGRLTFQVNRQVLVDLPMSAFGSTGYAEVEAFIQDDDDIKGSLRFNGVAPFSAPVITEWKHFHETTDEQIVLPGPLAALNPLLRRSRTFSQPVQREMSGSCLVQVYLQGDLKEPIGA